MGESTRPGADCQAQQELFGLREGLQAISLLTWPCCLESSTRAPSVSACPQPSAGGRQPAVLFAAQHWCCSHHAFGPYIASLRGSSLLTPSEYT